jgi:hypothetical protein
MHITFLHKMHVNSFCVVCLYSIYKYRNRMHPTRMLHSVCLCVRKEWPTQLNHVITGIAEKGASVVQCDASGNVPALNREVFHTTPHRHLWHLHTVRASVN